MKKNKYINIILTSMMLLNTVLTPQTIYAVSEITADESKETSQVESAEPVTEDIQNVVGTDEVNSAEVELAKPIIEGGEAAEDEKATPEDKVVTNKEPETVHNNSPPVEEKTDSTEETAVTAKTRAAVEQKENLISSFSFSVTTKSGENIKIDNGANLELDLNDMNAISLSYGITKPDDLHINAGDTYTIQLPKVFGAQAVEGKEITIDDVSVASYAIADGQIIITFNDNVNVYDNVEMFVNISGSFDTEIFETEKEVIVNVPYSEGNSFTAILRAKKQEYAGEDKKTAGKPYVLDEKGNKQENSKNPTHIDWTVIANDSMEKHKNATVIDNLGDHLEIDKDSFSVYQLVRDYNNVITDRKKVDVVPVLTENGFELNLGAIEDAYEIKYTTRITRPDGGGMHTINNSARIVLDGKETNVKDSFKGTWSGDVPVITKNGSIQEGQPNIVDWQVEYNFGKEEIGMVSLTDELTHGKVLLETIKIYEVVTDIDGNIISKSDTPIDIIPEVDENGNVILPNLDAKGKAYLITFSSSVPIGLNVDIVNTISDSIGNKDDATVNVNTIPTGGKIGEQHIDENGHPYIEWTITMNSQKIDVPSINIKDVFDSIYLDFDVSNSNLFELKRDGKAVDNFTIKEYTHKDGRTGFELQIADAGPYEYTFVYRTYYTTAGMQQKELANNAELVFDKGNGEGIGQIVDFSQKGPKAGIKKSGKYVLNEETGLQEIEWTIIFNDSRILLNNPEIIDDFTSKNYNYIENSLKMTENNETVADSDYVFNKTDNGFTININKNTRARYVITYRTTADDSKNEPQANLATLNWQGGSEEAKASVGKRDPGIKKSGAVVVNADGTKSINWTVDFNTNNHVIHNFKLTDTNEPATVDISNIKVTKGTENTDVTSDFKISDPEDGEFTVSAKKLEAVSYQLTYTTSLSPEEEQSVIKNTASIEYTGGNQKAEAVIKNP
ncbi:collagen binding domain-containing protein, partial [Carnobacterium sp.]|uniref:collagen binding domain-containing protein n=1 Tax=Carnobacterium sp. TaxID=48221 RepID=UPI0028AD3BDC